MKLIATGSLRRMHRHKLLDGSLMYRKGDDWTGRLSVHNSEEETGVVGTGVSIAWTKDKLTLNGDYDFTLVLSKEDVAQLFLRTFSKMDVTTLIALLTKALDSDRLHEVDRAKSLKAIRTRLGSEKD